VAGRRRGRGGALNRRVAVPGRVRLLVLALLAVVAAVSVLRASSNALEVHASHDFANLLKSAEVLQQEDVYRRWFTAMIDDDYTRAPSSNPAGSDPTYAPSSLALLMPFNLMSWPAAQKLWLALNLGFTAGLLLLCRRRFLTQEPRWVTGAIAALLLSSVCWRNIVMNGQLAIAALFFFLLAAELGDRRRPLLAGASLMLALVKYSLILFLLPWLIARRQWLPIIVAAGIHVVLTILVAARIHENPVALVLGSFDVGKRLAMKGYVDVGALAGHAGLPAAVALGVGLALAGAAAWAALRHRPIDTDLLLATLSFLAFILIYHRAYDGVVLLLPLCIAAARRAQDPALAAAVLGNVVLVWWVSSARHWSVWLEDGGPFYWLLAATWYGTLGLLIMRLDGRAYSTQPQRAEAA